MRLVRIALAVAAAGTLPTAFAGAAAPPPRSPLEFRHPRLFVPDEHAASFLLREPLIPGTVVDNALTWADLGIAGQPTTAQIESAAWTALLEHLQRAEA